MEKVKNKIDEKDDENPNEKRVEGESNRTFETDKPATSVLDQECI